MTNMLTAPAAPSSQPTARALIAAAAGALLLAAGPAAAQKLVMNEGFRGSDFGPAGTEWVELAVLEDLTATELESYFVGDSSMDGLGERAASLQFANMASIAPVFQAGTLIVIAGGGAGLPEDASYDFAGGDRTITLDANGGFLVRRGTLDFGSRDVFWIDTSDAPADAISPDGFAVKWGSVNPGSVLAASASATLPAFPNGGPDSAALLADPAEADMDANWGLGDPPTPGFGNGGANSAALAALPVELSAFALE